MLTFVTFNEYFKKFVIEPRTEEESAKHFEYFKSDEHGKIILTLKEHDVVYVMRPEVYRSVIDSLIKYFMNCILKSGPAVFGSHVLPHMYRDIMSPDTNMTRVQKFGKCVISASELRSIYLTFSKHNMTHQRGTNLLELVELLDYIQEKKLGNVIREENGYGLEIRVVHATRMIENHNHNNFNDLFLK